MTERPERKQQKQDLQAKLQTVTTWAEFEQWEDDMNDAAEGFALHGKRRGYWAYDFRQHHINPNRVTYLYDDGISTGKSLIKNLHRHLEVR